ncbi:MAG: PQQ-binding-like beta-propeller repeat protein [Polyangiaceae bacterium]
MKTAKLLPLLLALVPACGGGMNAVHLFSDEWTNDDGKSADRLWKKIGGTRVENGADVAVGVVSAERLVGMNLANGAKWSFAHPVDTRPMIAGHVVVASGGREVFALDAASGSKLWAKDVSGLSLRGAGDDGKITVVVLGDDRGEGSTLLAIQRDGSIVRQVETKKILGVPAVVAGHAFIPWGQQYVSALDLSNGDEAARILLRERTSRAFTRSGALYFGEIGFFRFDDAIAKAPQGKASHTNLPVRELPGNPVLMLPGDKKIPVVSTATDKVRLYARPKGPDVPMGLESERYFATYFRAVLGLEAKKGKTVWVVPTATDVQGGAVGKSALFTCEASGHVTAIDALTGAILETKDLGSPVASCVVSVDAYVPTSRGAHAQSLAAQVGEEVGKHDPELLAVDRMLVRELGELPDEAATRTLLELTNDGKALPDLVADARLALAKRTTGLGAMKTALDRHYDFLKDVLRPPPVGAIARALANGKDKSSAADLARHLFEPESSEADLKEIAKALVALSGASEGPALRKFVALYRGGAETDELADAVGFAAEALLAHGTKDDRALVTKFEADGLTTEGVRPKLAAALKATAPKDPPAKSTPAASGAPGKDQEKGAAKEKRRPARPEPSRP